MARNRQHVPRECPINQAHCGHHCFLRQACNEQPDQVTRLLERLDPLTYDATRPAHERVNGPGQPRLAHAFPHGSDVALCGALKGDRPQPPSGRRCAVCELEAGRRAWVAR